MYIGRSAMMLGLGQAQTCEDMLHLAETFERLMQKTDKSAETRRNAASNAQLWRGNYQTCLNQRAVATAELSLPSPGVPANAGAGAEGVVSPTPSASGTRSTLTTALLIGGGLVGGALLIGYLVRRRRG